VDISKEAVKLTTENAMRLVLYSSWSSFQGLPPPSVYSISLTH